MLNAFWSFLVQNPQHQPQYHHQPPPPPQQYQQQPPQHLPSNVAPQQQYQQPHQTQSHQQVQYQNVPVQQQQAHHVPVQQQTQQAMHVQQQQQVPQGHGGQVLNAANIQQEREHIQEHLQVPIDTSKMSEAELQFHYFKMHDSDNNNKLDGCELIKSLIHWHEQGNKEAHHHDPNQPRLEEKIFTDEELVVLIDPILQMDDTSRDGYIDYPEFIKAQQKAQQNHQQQQQQQAQKSGH
uniref:EF-hand domain-containing protein n=1 Tax=Glossina brevipalpis TaxID=37001 RepID=A0A1A9WNL4_9MUSC